MQLDLHDLRVLAAAAAAGDTDLVLDAPGEAVYQRTVDRFIATWAPCDGAGAA